MKILIKTPGRFYTTSGLAEELKDINISSAQLSQLLRTHMVGKKAMFSDGEVYGNYVFIKDKNGYGLIDRRSLITSTPQYISFEDPPIKNLTKGGQQVNRVIELIQSGKNFIEATQQTANEFGLSRSTILDAINRVSNSTETFCQTIAEGKSDLLLKHSVFKGISYIEKVVEYMKSGMTYIEATTKVADEFSVSRSTIIESINRRLGLSSKDFEEKVKNNENVFGG